MRLLALLMLLLLPVSAQAACPKPPLSGLMNRDGFPPESHLQTINNFTIQVNWADIQPEPFGSLIRGKANPIDAALERIHHYNNQFPKRPRLAIGIRILAGVHAPEWAKHLGGAPVQIQNITQGKPEREGMVVIPRFWTQEFAAAYNDLMSKLAAAYDTAPNLREVQMTRCTTIYGEPFIRAFAAYPLTLKNMLAAGYSVHFDKTCHAKTLESHNRIWKHTASRMVLNPYHSLDNQLRPVVDTEFTLQTIAACRSLLGPRCVLANHSLRSHAMGKPYTAMYDFMSSYGSPITFQTATCERLAKEPVAAALAHGAQWKTLARALSSGASAVELPSCYRTDNVFWPVHSRNNKNLRYYDEMLEQNQRGCAP